MTLIAGFTGFGGVALCADSQETVGDYSKRTVEKIRWVSMKEMSVAFAGAGPGHFVDLVSHQIENGVRALRQDALSVDQVTIEIERILKDYYEKHVWTRPDPSNAQIEFLVTCTPAHSGHGPLLFHAAETALTWIEGGYKTIGVGCHLADFLFEHLHTGRGDKWHMFAVGTYILNKVSEYVEGVGRGTNVIVLTRHGEQFCPCTPKEIEQLNTALGDFDKSLKDCFLGVTDVDRTSAREPWNGNEPSLGELEASIQELRSVRDKMIKLTEEHAEFEAGVRSIGKPRTA